MHATDRTPSRILVVDDEEPLVRLATETLANLGYLPFPFTSSLSALDAFRATPGAFDAVLTDERMPEMSGSVLIGAVRSVRPSLPIVLMTGYLMYQGKGRRMLIQKNQLTLRVSTLFAR